MNKERNFKKVSSKDVIMRKLNIGNWVIKQNKRDLTYELNPIYDIANCVSEETLKDLDELIDAMVTTKCNEAIDITKQKTAEEKDREFLEMVNDFKIDEFSKFAIKEWEDNLGKRLGDNDKNEFVSEIYNNEDNLKLLLEYLKNKWVAEK